MWPKPYNIGQKPNRTKFRLENVIRLDNYKFFIYNKSYMIYFFYALIAAAIVSLLSLVGAFAVFILKDKFQKTLLFFISFSAGSLIGGAFFHLLPESLEMAEEPITIFIFSLVGFCLFFVLERVLRWRHCHKGHCETHAHVGWLVLFGDSVHNLIDGLVIASAFAAGPAVGIPVAFSIAAHEVPQEVGDFAVLIYAGLSKVKALFYNLLSALVSVLGVIFGYFLLNEFQGINTFLLPFAAGGFIYIAASDLIPEIHEEKDSKKSIFSFLIFVFALIFMYFLKINGVE